MNRRTALFFSMLAGGLVPARLMAQDRGGRARALDPEPEPIEPAPVRGGFRRPRPTDDRLARDNPDDEPLPEEGPALEDVPGEALPPDLPTERGHAFRTFDISRYTSLEHHDSQPQNALVEWIFRRTGSAIWHGDDIAVLSVNRAQLRAYHNANVLKQVEEMVLRFTDAQPSDTLRLRVRIVAAEDTRWRSAVASRLDLKSTGPDGQSLWFLDVEDAAMVRNQMMIYRGFKLLEDREVTIINGQTFSLSRDLDVDYISAPQRDSAVGLGYQPAVSKLKEGVYLRLSPLLTYAGDAIDLALDLRAVTVRRLLPTRIMVGREIGPGEMTIDVPEAVETRMNQNVSGWKLGQTLLIAGGIHPGILQAKSGFLNLRVPGTVPTKTELLVFLDCETVGEPPPRTARRREE